MNPSLKKTSSTWCQRQISKRLTKGNWYSDGAESILKFEREEDSVLLFSAQAGKSFYTTTEDGLIPFMKVSLFFRLNKSDKELLKTLDIVQ
jgi:hypothetical protein